MANSFVVPTKAVEWGTGENAQSIQVRGLSYQDFVVLFTTFGRGVDQILEFVESAKKGEKVNLNIEEFGLGMIQSSPEVVALLIALACDMPDQASQVQRIALPVQIRFLEEIYALTVTEVMPLPDFLIMVTRIAKSISKTTHLLPSSQPAQEPEMPASIITG